MSKNRRIIEIHNFFRRAVLLFAQALLTWTLKETLSRSMERLERICVIDAKMPLRALSAPGLQFKEKFPSNKCKNSSTGQTYNYFKTFLQVTKWISW